MIIIPSLSLAQSVRPNSTYGIVEGAPPLTVRCDSSDSAVDAYDWSKDGRPINSSTIPGLTISGGSITISSANHTLHNGSYSCAINGSDDLEEEFTVFVYCKLVSLSSLSFSRTHVCTTLSLPSPLSLSASLPLCH